MTQQSEPLKVNLPREQRAVRRQVLLAFALCLPILALASLGLPRVFTFPDSLAERLAFALRLNIVIGLWVVLAIRKVARIRFESAQDNAGSAYSEPSPRLKVAAAFLQNTLEQGFVAVLGNLALATVPGPQPLAFLPAAVILFSLGRVTFLRGYHHGAGGRAFGVATTAIPIICAYVWSLVDIGRNSL